MASVGERLRGAREELHLSIHDLASEMRINAHYLEAIEADNLNELPSGFVARSFVRQYANRLGVPAEELATELERWFENPIATDPQSLTPKTMNIGLAPVTHVLDGNPKPRRKLLGALATLVVVVGGCAVLYSLWLQRQQERPLAQLVQEPPPPPVAAEQTPSAKPEQPSAATELASRIGESAPADLPASSGQDAAEPMTPATERQDGPVNFELVAVEEVWVRVKTGDETLYSGILSPGDKRSFGGLRLATVRMGNAAGLRALIHGRDIGRLGGPGQIRILTITPDKTEITSPEPVRPSLPEDGAGEVEPGTADAQ